MTKRHFERLAKALLAARKAAELDADNIGHWDNAAVYELFVDQIALACSEFSDTFQYGQFRRACGLEG